MANKIKVKIVTYLDRRYDPSITVYNVLVLPVNETPECEWRESFGSEPQVDNFVRGVKAAASFAGQFDVEVEREDHQVSRGVEP